MMPMRFAMTRIVSTGVQNLRHMACTNFSQRLICLGRAIVNRIRFATAAALLASFFSLQMPAEAMDQSRHKRDKQEEKWERQRDRREAQRDARAAREARRESRYEAR